MKKSETNRARELTEDEVLRELYNGCLDRRPIVPLLGAGISVESGYPTTGSIVRYLAKVRYFLKKNLYLPDHSSATDWGTGLCYDRKEHIGWFGWPDPYQLNDDLWDSGEINDDLKQLSEVLTTIYREYQEAEDPEEAERLKLMHKLFKRATEKQQRAFAAAKKKKRKKLPDDQVKAFLRFRRTPAITPKWRPILALGHRPPGGIRGQPVPDA